MSKIAWIIFTIAFGLVVFYIVLSIKTDIEDKFVAYGVPTGLLIAVLYTCLSRISKTTPVAKKQPINLFEKLMTMLFIAASILVLCGSVVRASDRRELSSLATGLSNILAAAAACAYLEERLKSPRNRREKDHTS